MTTTATSRCWDPGTTENDYEEPKDTALRRQLGLRPTWYPRTDETRHPDEHPCPAWCWIPRLKEEKPGFEGLEHEVDTGHPMDATHRYDSGPKVVASLYKGESEKAGPPEGDAPYVVETATIDLDLEQVGQGPTVVTVALRHYKDGRHVFLRDLLRLTVADARDMITALTYLVETAHAGA